MLGAYAWRLRLALTHLSIDGPRRFRDSRRSACVWNAARSSLVYIEMESVTLRNIRGSLVLGLLVSLAAHVALFGGQHTVGGAYHAVLMQGTSAVTLGFVAFLGALAWALSRSSSDGSVLAARLREQLPGLGSVVASAASWYAGIEAIEPHHLGAPVIELLVVLIAASYLVLLLARAMTDTFAHAAITISRTSFSPRVPAWRRRPRERVLARHSFQARRRFARPPPVAVAFPRV
mgnify:CR=1 FL=1